MTTTPTVMAADKAKKKGIGKALAK
jgi:hypothetical protein